MPLQNPPAEAIGSAMPSAFSSATRTAFAPGHWLIFADTSGYGTTMANHLSQQGQHCTLVYASSAPDTTLNATAHSTADSCFEASGSKTRVEHSVDPGNRQALTDLIQQRLDQASLPLVGVIYLWSLDLPDLPHDDLPWDAELADPEQIVKVEIQLNAEVQTLQRSQHLSCGSLMHIMQTLLTRDGLLNDPPRLWVMTRGCQAIANRFQRYYDNGTLKYMRTGMINGYPVICVGTSTGGSCRQRDVLVTLKWGKNPASILEQMTDLRGRARGEILELNYDEPDAVAVEPGDNENPDRVIRESLLFQDELLPEDEVLFYVDGEAYLDMEVFLNLRTSSVR